MTYVDPQQNREFRQIADGWYRFGLLREGILMDAKRLRWERGELFGLLIVQCDIAGAKAVDGTVSVGTFNLTSVSARSGRAKDLHEQVKAPRSTGRTCSKNCASGSSRRGTWPSLSSCLRMSRPTNSEDRMVKVFGLPIPLDHPTIWYAAGGTGKSTLAAALTGELEQRGIPTLILDWETSEDDYRATAVRLFGDDLPDIKYRRCDRPLVIEAESIAQQIDECAIRYVVIDSAGYAADGRPEDAEVALRFFRALRTLRVGSLTLAHISSGEHGSDRPFGSVFLA